MIASSHAKRLIEEQKMQRVALQQAGVKPKAQLDFLQQHYRDVLCVARYNEPQKQRREFLDGRTPIPALIDVLEAKNYYFI